MSWVRVISACSCSWPQSDAFTFWEILVPGTRLNHGDSTAAGKSQVLGVVHCALEALLLFQMFFFALAAARQAWLGLAPVAGSEVCCAFGGPKDALIRCCAIASGGFIFIVCLVS